MLSILYLVPFIPNGVHTITNLFFFFLINNRGGLGGYCKIVNSSIRKLWVEILIRMQGKRMKWSMVAIISYSQHVLWIYIFGEFIFSIWICVVVTVWIHIKHIHLFGYDRIRVKIIYYYISLCFVFCVCRFQYFWWFHFCRFNFVVDSVHTPEITASQQ